jgi:type VI secretion system secreted protein VgrG
MPRNLRITTPLGDNVLLFEQMNGHEALGAPFEYRISALSENADLDLASLLGQKITVEVDLPRGGTRHFSGFVTTFSFAGTEGALARYHLVVRPWLWLLSLGSNCRIFQKQTAVEIVQKVWRDRGFTEFREALSGEYQPLEYSVQYRESDFNYISRLLEQEGIYYYFEHADGKHTLVLSDSADSHTPAPGYAEVPYFPPTNMDRRLKDNLSSWSAAQQMRPGVYSSTDYDFTRPRASLAARLQKPAAHSHADFEVFDYPGQHLTSEEGESKVKVRLEAHQAPQQVATASGNVMGLPVGALFTLTDYPRLDQNQQYLVVSASYDLATNAYGSGGGGEVEFRGTYVLAPSSHPYRPPAVTPRPRVDGPQTATVVGKAGEEIWTDKYGRVRLQFHWDRDGQSDEQSSCWVRVSQQWAGRGFGAISVPRIGEEVIVDFLEGDPDRPIVTGRVYNGDHLPPYELPALATQTGIKSRSSKGGTPQNFNELRLEDKKGAELINVQAEKDLNLLVKDKTTGLHQGGREVTVQKFDDTTVKDGNKNVTVKNGQFNLMADKTVNLKSAQEVFIEVGGAVIHIDATGAITVKGTTIKLNSG